MTQRVRYTTWATTTPIDGTVRHRWSVGRLGPWAPNAAQPGDPAQAQPSARASCSSGRSSGEASSLFGPTWPEIWEDGASIAKGFVQRRSLPDQKRPMNYFFGISLEDTEYPHFDFRSVGVVKYMK